MRKKTVVIWAAVTAALIVLGFAIWTLDLPSALREMHGG